MLPAFPTTNTANAGDGNAKSNSYISKNQSVFSESPHLFNHFFIEFGVWLLFASFYLLWMLGCPVFFTNGVSAFFNHVFNVVQICSKKQMRRIHALWIVALVKHPKTFGNRPIMNFPRVSVGRISSLFRTETTMSSFVHCRRSPIPTTSKFPILYVGWRTSILIDLFPKSLKCWLTSLNHPVNHKQKTHRFMKVMSAQIEPQSQNGESNLFYPSAFCSHIKAACSFA